MLSRVPCDDKSIMCKTEAETEGAVSGVYSELQMCFCECALLGLSVKPAHKDKCNHCLDYWAGGCEHVYTGLHGAESYIYIRTLVFLGVFLFLCFQCFVVSLYYVHVLRFPPFNANQ